MGQAYELVHGYIDRAGLTDGDSDGLCELVARRIIEKAASGETDPKALADYAIFISKIKCVERREAGRAERRVTKLARRRQKTSVSEFQWAQLLSSRP